MLEIARQYQIPGIGWVGIIHGPCKEGPYYARFGNCGIVAANSTSEDEVRVRIGTAVSVLLGSKKTELENQLQDVQSVLTEITSSQTPLIALDRYEVKN